MEKESGASEDFIARRTESLDAHGISKLVKKSTEAIFGRTNAESIMLVNNTAAGSGTRPAQSLINRFRSWGRLHWKDFLISISAVNVVSPLSMMIFTINVCIVLTVRRLTWPSAWLALGMVSCWDTWHSLTTPSSPPWTRPGGRSGCMAPTTAQRLW